MQILIHAHNVLCACIHACIHAYNGMRKRERGFFLLCVCVCVCVCVCTYTSVSAGDAHASTWTYMVHTKNNKSFIHAHEPFEVYLHRGWLLPRHDPTVKEQCLVRQYATIHSPIRSHFCSGNNLRSFDMQLLHFVPL